MENTTTVSDEHKDIVDSKLVLVLLMQSDNLVTFMYENRSAFCRYAYKADTHKKVFKNSNIRISVAQEVKAAIDAALGIEWIQTVVM